MLGRNQQKWQQAATDGRRLESTVCRALTRAGTDGAPFSSAQVLVTVNANGQQSQTGTSANYEQLFTEILFVKVKRLIVFLSLFLWVELGVLELCLSGFGGNWRVLWRRIDPDRLCYSTAQPPLGGKEQTLPRHASGLSSRFRGVCEESQSQSLNFNSHAWVWSSKYWSVFFSDWQQVSLLAPLAKLNSSPTVRKKTVNSQMSGFKEEFHSCFGELRRFSDFCWLFNTSLNIHNPWKWLSVVYMCTNTPFDAQMACYLRVPGGQLMRNGSKTSNKSEFSPGMM